MPVPPFFAAWRFAALGLILGSAAFPQPVSTVRVVTPELLELEWVQPHVPQKAGPALPWNLAPAAMLAVPAPERFAVTVAGRPVAVREVGLKRRVASARLADPELAVATWLYLRLAGTAGAADEVAVTNPDGGLWQDGTRFLAPASGSRASPAIHVSQEGYAARLPKRAMVGYYLGTLGELPVAARHFRIITRDGRVAHEGPLVRRPDRGYAYGPAPYQEVWEADFSACAVPGEYRLEVPALGNSAWFRIDDGVVLGVARAYALGLYHQRCGQANELPYTRFGHAACHLAPAAVPLPAEEHPFTWATLARLRAAGDKPGAAAAPAAKAEAGPRAAEGPVEIGELFPIIRRGAVEVAGGHHDAGDYSKYTTNSAAFVHVLVFAVDVLPGAAARDDLGWPESGDGIPDLLQAAKWEADFLAKLQDDDGGFHFLVYPRDRAYESDVLPDAGDPQVVWPKNTAATAAGVAALAQASSSPRLRRHFPEAAQRYRRQAERGWKFLEEAWARHGRAGAYQRLTHYGDNFGDADELAWAAGELFLATGEESYHRRFRELCDPAQAAVRRWGWWRLSESWGNAIRSYAFAVKSGRRKAAELDPRWRERCEAEVAAAGQDVLRWAEESAYGTSFPVPTKRMRGGGWYFSLAQAFDLAVASELEHPAGRDPRPRMLAAYATNLGYELGVNPVNVCYITGLGTRSPREIVHQFAQNDRRLLPPSGLPVGNLQAGQPYLPSFKEALRELSFPADGAANAPYPYYDRWSDLPNVAAEFVIVDQARALAGLAWLAGRTGLANRPWRPEVGRIEGAPETIRVGERVAVRLVAPAGYDLGEAAVVWEAAGGQLGAGVEFAFVAAGSGPQWIEAEARWPDGRRLFAVGEFSADNGRPEVTVEATAAEASVSRRTAGAVTFRRSGAVDEELVVRFELRGTAAKWSEYRRPEGDMPTEFTIPAGESAATMRIVPVAAGLGNRTREVRVILKADERYNVGPAREGRVRLVP